LKTRGIVVALAALAPAWVWAAEAAHPAADKLKGFGLAESASTPAFGRVIMVFLLLAALCWGMVWLLKKHGKRFGLAGATLGAADSSPIRHVARSSLPGGIVCHLVEAQGSRVLITVSRQGVSSLVLGATPPAVSSGGPA
jgi:hypothetical protein